MCWTLFSFDKFIMSDELLRVLNAPGDDESALERLWQDYAMRGIDEDSDGDSQTQSESQWSE